MRARRTTAIRPQTLVGLGRVELPTSPLSVVTERDTTTCEKSIQAAIYAGAGAMAECEAE